jgi:hypothetical protein
LKKYIFTTPEVLTYQPNSDSPQPDFMDMEIMGFGHTLEDALKDILELSEHPEENKLRRTFFLDLKNDSRKYFSLRDYKETTRIAS